MFVSQRQPRWGILYVKINQCLLYYLILVLCCKPFVYKTCTVYKNLEGHRNNMCTFDLFLFTYAYWREPMMAKQVVKAAWNFAFKVVKDARQC